jgi:hypothetical protein
MYKTTYFDYFQDVIGTHNHIFSEEIIGNWKSSYVESLLH